MWTELEIKVSYVRQSRTKGRRQIHETTNLILIARLILVSGYTAFHSRPFMFCIFSHFVLPCAPCTTVFLLAVLVFTEHFLSYVDELNLVLILKLKWST